jgi:HemY protein
MKKLVLWAALFVIAAGLAALALMDNGQLSLVWGDWVIETSVSFAIVLTVLGFVAIYLLAQAALFVWRFPARRRQRKQMKRYANAERHVAKGLIALEYGDWQTAEKQLLKSAKSSGEAGLVHYLSAAKMAHNQQAYDRRDRYLAEAKQRYPEEMITISLVEARLIAEQDPQRAASLLKVLHEEVPSNRVVLAEYLQVLQKIGAWQEIEALLPEAKRLKALDKVALQALEVALTAAKIRQMPDLASLEAFWSQLPKNLQLNPKVLAEYVEQKMGWGEESGLVELIEMVLKKQWDDRLVYQYGRLQVSPAFQRLKVAQKWLQKHPESPVLLLTLGRLACMSQLWAQGQHYLKQSLKLQPEVETFHALAQCYEAEGAAEQAAITYKDAVLALEDSKNRH